jgi:sugar phosphate permease
LLFFLFGFVTTTHFSLPRMSSSVNRKTFDAGIYGSCGLTYLGCCAASFASVGTLVLSPQQQPGRFARGLMTGGLMTTAVGLFGTFALLAMDSFARSHQNYLRRNE